MQEILKRHTEKYLSRFPRIYFCHVPKCAGVSLSDAIFEAIYPSIFKATRFAGYIDLKASRQCETLLGTDMMTAREIQLTTQLSNPHQRFTTGHCIARPEVVSHFCNDWHFLTILRQPTERFISEYVYNRFKQSDWQKSELAIEQYLESDRAYSSATTYARYFSGFSRSNEIFDHAEETVRRAVANLRHFSVCGTLEHIDAWQTAFKQRFSTRIRVKSKNMTPDREASLAIINNPGVMTRITELSRVDQAIYDQVVSTCRQDSRIA